MIIQRKSIFTGKVRSRDIPVKKKDYDMWANGYLNIQDAMGYLDSDSREFILTGATREEFNAAFQDEISKIVKDKL